MKIRYVEDERSKLHLDLMNNVNVKWLWPPIIQRVPKSYVMFSYMLPLPLFDQLVLDSCCDQLVLDYTIESCCDQLVLDS